MKTSLTICQKAKNEQEHMFHYLKMFFHVSTIFSSPLIIIICQKNQTFPPNFLAHSDTTRPKRGKNTQPIKKKLASLDSLVSRKGSSKHGCSTPINQPCFFSLTQVAQNVIGNLPIRSSFSQNASGRYSRYSRSF